MWHVPYPIHGKTLSQHSFLKYASQTHLLICARPISVTSILSRLTKNFIVKRYLRLSTAKKIWYWNIIHQSINIYIRQPQPTEARPIHIKTKKAHTTLYKITTQTNEKRKKLSRYWSETSSSHLYFSAISSYRGRANSLNIMVTL